MAYSSESIDEYSDKKHIRFIPHKPAFWTSLWWGDGLFRPRALPFLLTLLSNNYRLNLNYMPFLIECSRTFFWYKSIIVNIWYINWIIMEKEKRVPAAESERHHLVKKKFEREERGTSISHTYNLCTHWMIQITKVFLLPTFPQFSGKSRKTKRSSRQRRTSNCGWVTQWFNAGDNRIGEKGCIALSKINLRKLTVLNLRN